MEDQSEKPEIQSQESEQSDPSDKSDMPAEASKMTPAMMRALLHMLLTSVHGITVPQQTFDTYDPNAPMCMTFEPTLKVWRFWIPQPVIVTPVGTNGGALVTPPRKIARRILRKRGF